MSEGDGSSEARGWMKGRAAIVTGGGSGIGRATAVALAHEGADVAVVDIDSKGGTETVNRIRSSGVKGLYARADVTREDEVRGAVQEALRTFGKLDTLVNNAGIAVAARISETSEGDWDRVIDTNLKGAFLMSKHTIPHMVAAGGGAIVNTASDAGIVGFAKLGAYCASKGGLIQLTRSLAVELGEQHVRVNAVAPTSTLGTRMFDAVLESSKEPEAILRALSDAHPLKRLGTADEVAKLIVFLASSNAAYITGAVFSIDGGITAACPVAEI